jgi:hypothetical protein
MILRLPNRPDPGTRNLKSGLIVRVRRSSGAHDRRPGVIDSQR